MKSPPRTTPAPVEASINQANETSGEQKSGERRKPPPKTTPALVEARINQEAIGAGLRRLFDEVINEPVPEDFLAILRDADDGSDAPDDNVPDARR